MTIKIFKKLPELIEKLPSIVNNQLLIKDKNISTLMGKGLSLGIGETLIFQKKTLIFIRVSM